jgi:hypothetical protein
MPPRAGWHRYQTPRPSSINHLGTKLNSRIPSSAVSLVLVTNLKSTTLNHVPDMNHDIARSVNGLPMFMICRNWTVVDECCQTDRYASLENWGSPVSFFSRNELSRVPVHPSRQTPIAAQLFLTHRNFLNDSLHILNELSLTSIDLWVSFRHNHTYFRISVTDNIKSFLDLLWCFDLAIITRLNSTDINRRVSILPVRNRFRSRRWDWRLIRPSPHS